jgi:hypothetical protein
VADEDMAQLEEVAHERARRAGERERAALRRAEEARGEAARAPDEASRARHEREASTHERAAESHRRARALQQDHAEHARELGERRAADAEPAGNEPAQ